MRIILTKGGGKVRKTSMDGAPADAAYGAGRSTVQRRAVAAAAAAFDRAFTADDLAARAREDSPRLSTATIYRSMAAMAASGFLTEVGERDGAVLYARCVKTGHHHHVVCTGCGATAHTPCPVDGPALAAAAPAGFVVTSHELRMYGLCATCVEERREADGCSCDAEAVPDTSEAPSDPSGGE